MASSVHSHRQRSELEHVPLIVSEVFPLHTEAAVYPSDCTDDSAVRSCYHEFMSTLAMLKDPGRREARDFRSYPQLRYMGSKHRLLEWIGGALGELQFESALDAFSGSGCVSYLLKCMGKRVISSDFLNFAHEISRATIENADARLSDVDCDLLCMRRRGGKHFIRQTFSGIFFSDDDLAFLDTVWSNLARLRSKYKRALAIAAMARACVKRQPRGVFTVAGGCAHYDDGRRDLRLSLKEHFAESVTAYNQVVFDNGRNCRSLRMDVLTGRFPAVDLVYLDPPYVPRSDDNCYIKRYHFLEGLSTYWRDPQAQIDFSTRVRKIPKRFTPFSYRRTALEAFDTLFRRFRKSCIVLSYSSNGFPDLDALVVLMARYKNDVQVLQREHRYHFGTHASVASERAQVKEFLIIGK